MYIYIYLQISSCFQLFYSSWIALKSPLTWLASGQASNSSLDDVQAGENSYGEIWYEVCLKRNMNWYVSTRILICIWTFNNSWEFSQMWFLQVVYVPLGPEHPDPQEMPTRSMWLMWLIQEWLPASQLWKRLKTAESQCLKGW